MDKIKLLIIVILIIVIIGILIAWLVPKSKKEILSSKKEQFRPIYSTQDNCAKCTTKYTKYAHNKPLNSDGQIII